MQQTSFSNQRLLFIFIWKRAHDHTHRWGATCLDVFGPVEPSWHVAPRCGAQSRGQECRPLFFTERPHQLSAQPWQQCLSLKPSGISAVSESYRICPALSLSLFCLWTVKWIMLPGWSSFGDLCVDGVRSLALLQRCYSCHFISHSLSTCFTLPENVLKHCSESKGWSRVWGTDSESVWISRSLCLSLSLLGCRCPFERGWCHFSVAQLPESGSQTVSTGVVSPKLVLNTVANASAGVITPTRSSPPVCCLINSETLAPDIKTKSWESKKATLCKSYP